MCAATLKFRRSETACRQSGVIPYRIANVGVEVMLISNRGGSRLIVPKGRIERDLSPVESAQKEAFEEAGIVGSPHREPIGSIEGMRRGECCRIELWPMRVTSMYTIWPEMAFRQRLWVKAENAAQLLDRDDLAKLIWQLARRLSLARVAA